MKLPYTLEKLDGVDKAFHGLYEEQDGKFVLSVDGLPEPEDTSGLKTALEKERADRRKYEKQIKAWERLGKSSDEISELLTKLEEDDIEAKKKRGDVDALLKQHQEKWEKEKAALEAELNASRGSERKAIIGSSLMAALSKAGATEEGIELLPERLSQRISFEIKDGERVVTILSTDGETPMAGTAQDGKATFDDLVKEAVKKYPSLFEGSGVGGSGKQHDKKSGGTGVSKRSDLKTSAERAAFIDEHGLEAYQQLPY